MSGEAENLLYTLRYCHSFVKIHVRFPVKSICMGTRISSGDNNRKYASSFLNKFYVLSYFWNKVFNEYVRNLTSKGDLNGVQQGGANISEQVLNIFKKLRITSELTGTTT